MDINTDKYYKKIFMKFFVVGALSAASNVFFYNNKTISYLVVAAQIIIFIYHFAHGHIAMYMAYYILILSACLEFEEFVGTSTFYNFKNIRIAGVNLGIIFLVPIFIWAFMAPIKVNKNRYTYFYKFGLSLLGLNVLAAFMGLILIIVNDNKIKSVTGYFSSYVGTAYSSLFLPLSFFLGFALLLSYERENLKLISVALQAVLCSNVIQMMLSVGFGVMGQYGKTSTLMAGTVYFFVPFMLLFFLQYDYLTYSRFCFVLGIIGTILVLSNNANGKVIIVTIVSLVIIIISLLADKDVKKKLFAIILLIFSMILIPTAFSWLSENNILFMSKLNQVLGLFSFWKGDWLDSMQYSPRARIGELLNVFIEYSKKPWLFLTGKGYVGSIKDYVNMFGSRTVNTAAYTDAEWISETFFNLHEISSTILMFGLPGIVYFVKLIQLLVKNFRRNIWLIFGVYWVIVLYGYSFTLSVFGVTAFFLGLCYIACEDEEITV